MAERVKCTFCEKKQQFMKLCSRCRSDVYCSKECQVQDWPSHKKKCSSTKQQVKKKSDINTFNENCHDSLSKHKIDDIAASPSIEQTLTVESSAKTSYLCTEDSSSEKIKDESFADMNLEGNIVDNSSTKDNDILIYVKHNKVKSELRVNMLSQDGNSIYQQISSLVQIPTGKLKLVCKGKIITPESITTVIKNKTVFLAIGEVAENEDGIHTGDVETLMKQLNVDRNVAVRALKKTGSLLDAIFHVGNNL